MNFKLRWLVSDLGSLPIGALLICLRSLLNLLKNRAPPSVGGLLHRRDLFHLHCLVSMASSSETVKLLLYSSFDMLSPTDQLSLFCEKTLLSQPSRFSPPVVPDLELKCLSTARSHTLAARNSVPLQLVSRFSVHLRLTGGSPLLGRSPFPLPEPPPPPDPLDPPDFAAFYYPVKTGTLHPLVLNEYFINSGLFPFSSMCFVLKSTYNQKVKYLSNQTSIASSITSFNSPMDPSQERNKLVLTSPVTLISMVKFTQTSSRQGRERSFSIFSFSKERFILPKSLFVRGDTLPIFKTGKIYEFPNRLLFCVKARLGPVDATMLILMRVEVLASVETSHAIVTNRVLFVDFEVHFESFIDWIVCGIFDFLHNILSNLCLYPCILLNYMSGI